MEDKTVCEEIPESKFPDVRPGMKVYGILRMMRASHLQKDRAGTYHGTITAVSEKGFSVKWDAVISPIPYEFKSLGHIVFIDKNACLEQEIKMDGPQLEEGFFDAVPKTAKKEKTENP